MNNYDYCKRACTLLKKLLFSFSFSAARCVSRIGSTTSVCAKKLMLIREGVWCCPVEIRYRIVWVAFMSGPSLRITHNVRWLLASGGNSREGGRSRVTSHGSLMLAAPLAAYDLGGGPEGGA